MTALEKAVKKVGDSGDYIVLRKFHKEMVFDADDGADKNLGLVIDFATTGTGDGAKPIELCAILVEYGPQTGKIYSIVDSYYGMEDPGECIPEDVVSLTGITDDTVKGQTFSDETVLALAKRANVIISHYADFDRKIAERRFSLFAEKPWICSCTQVDWKREGVASRHLEFIAYKLGFAAELHRPRTNAFILLRILAETLPVSRKRVMLALLENGRKAGFTIFVRNYPFAQKEFLYEHGYQWESGETGKDKGRYKTVNCHDEMRKELDFLAKHVYNAARPMKNNVVVTRITAVDRFSERALS